MDGGGVHGKVDGIDHSIMTGTGFIIKHTGFYFDVTPGWRIYYKNRNWQGHRWHYEKISNQRLQQNWKNWQNNRYWEREKTWGVENYQPQINGRGRKYGSSNSRTPQNSKTGRSKPGRTDHKLNGRYSNSRTPQNSKTGRSKPGRTDHKLNGRYSNSRTPQNSKTGRSKPGRTDHKLNGRYSNSRTPQNSKTGRSKKKYF
jgi:hypothetical protein